MYAEFKVCVFIFFTVVQNVLNVDLLWCVLRQRITAAQIYKTDWFKKGYTPAKFKQKDDISLEDIESVFSKSTVRSTLRSHMQLSFL
jgi:hypothetical protein